MTAKPLFQAISIETSKPVGKPRNSIQFARSDARRHFAETGEHSAVCKIEVVWDTSHREPA